MADDLPRISPAPAPPTLRPRVTMEVTGATLAQVVTEGVEFIVDTVEHHEDGERLTVTLSGPVRHRDDDRGRGIAKVVAAVTRRIRGR